MGRIPRVREARPWAVGYNRFAVKKEEIRGKKNPLSAAGLKNLCEEHAKTIAPAREQAAEALQLEGQLGDPRQSNAPI